MLWLLSLITAKIATEIFKKIRKLFLRGQVRPEERLLYLERDLGVGLVRKKRDTWRPSTTMVMPGFLLAFAALSIFKHPKGHRRIPEEGNRRCLCLFICSMVPCA